ncbi:MAG TPA: tetratricopeptide repeat protein [Gemmataceae bacterium]|nr:tetratricopeptide repeat protein [Gemmataceae bacterium]
MREKLNLRFSAYVLVSGLVLSLGWYLVHAAQVTRTADALLQVATRAEDQGQFDRAARLFSLYLERRPTDMEALARYGQLLDKLAGTAGARDQVIDVFEQVLVREPEKKDIRRRLAQLALQNDDAGTALTHLTILQKALPKDSEVAHLLGICHASKANYKEAAHLFHTAMRLEPARVESYLALADLLRDRLDQPEEADRVLDNMLKTNRQSFQAYLAHARYQLKVLRKSARDSAPRLRAQADKDVAQALRLAPSNPEVLLLASHLAQEEGRVQRARDYLRRGIDKNPRVVTLHQALALLEIRAGRPAEAMKGLRDSLKALPDNGELRWFLADTLMDRGELREAEQVTEEFGKLYQGDPRFDYLRARLCMARRQWLEAIALFDKTVPLLEHVVPLRVECLLFLAQCYGQLHDVDRQLVSYRQAAALDALQIPARLGVAAALAEKGRLDDAIEEYLKVMQLPEAPASCWNLVARQMLLRNLRLPPSARHWEQLEEILKQAESKAADRVDLALLRAEVLVDQQHFEEARRLLEKLRTGEPKKVEVWTALAGVAAREGKWLVVDQTLEEARRQLGDRIELRLERLRLLLDRYGLGAASSFPKVAAGLERFPKEDRVRLLAAIAEAYTVCGQFADALVTWKQVEALEPDNLTVHLHLFDLAMETGAQASIRDAETAVRRIEGEAGAYGNYCAACRCIQDARTGDPEPLTTARELLSMVGRQRPDWPQVPLGLAQIAELEGNAESAITHYRQAVELGDHGPGVVRQLVRLLYQRQRYREAEEVVSSLQEQAPISTEVQKLAAEMALLNLNPGRALEWAQKAVSNESKDYRDHIWLGQFLWAADRKTEAERALRRARALAEDNPDPWVALVQYQVRTGQIREAEDTIQQAQRKLTPQVGALALAQCYEAVNQPVRAEEKYRAALTLAPEDVSVLYVVAEFYRRTGQFSKAEPILRKILDPHCKAPDSTARWARRSLAVGLASAGPFPDFEEALTLVDRNLENGSGTVDDQLAKAAVLATRPVYRRDAAPILEKAFKEHAPTAKEQALLVRLYETTGRSAEARDALRSLLAGHGRDPLVITAYVENQLRQARWEEAEPWLAALRELQPHAFATSALQARLLALRGEGTALLEALKAYLRDKNSEPHDAPTRMRLVAALLDQLSQDFKQLRGVLDPAAEELYRKDVSLSRSADALLALGNFLARRDRVAESLDLCERAWSIGKLETVAAISVLVVSRAAANERDLRRVEEWLTAALQKIPRAGPVQVALAFLREHQRRYAEAEAIYRKILEHDKNNAVAWNNLAYLLVLRGADPEECLDKIENAIKIAGPTPEFLDTRAVIYLALGKSDLAIADLKEAVADGPTSSGYFHLARAYQMARQQGSATDALAQSQKLGLDAQSLHPLEREQLLGVLKTD